LKLQAWGVFSTLWKRFPVNNPKEIDIFGNPGKGDGALNAYNRNNAAWTHWVALWTVSVLAGFSYVLMEWIFFATKPSFMSTLGFWDKFKILMIAPVPFILVCTAVISLLWGVDQMTRKPGTRIFLIRSARVAPAVILGALFFLLLDNFTYTLLGFGIQSVKGSWRGLYFLVFLFFTGWGYYFCGKIEARIIMKNRTERAGIIAVVLSGVFAGFLFSAADFSILQTAGAGTGILRQEKLPNILLITSDGLSADHLSAYGYKRETTPFIGRYCRDKALFCENAFPNAANTSGSIASMLTGKETAKIRIYYPPEILTGKDAYEHLPGILRRYGYFNIDISIRQFADANDLNMRNSFDVGNDRKFSFIKLQTFSQALFGQTTGYFLEQTLERFQNRLLYSVGMTDYVSSYDEVTGRDRSKDLNDDPRMDLMLSSIRAAREQPFFVHAHFLGTHGALFYPKNQVFSQGQTQTGMWMKDFYDDAILEFDRNMEEIIKTLKDEGKLDNTIIVIGSDHATQYKSGIRIPLIFLFPNGAHAGRIQANVQNLDIAPTLLDYLKIPKPDWMAGRSLLSPGLDRFYPIFSTEVNRDRVKAWIWMVDDSKSIPPFYSLGNIAVNICNKVFRLYVDKFEYTVSTVAGHTDPCPEDQIPSEATVKKILFDHLEQNNYDVSSLNAWDQTFNKGS
jgi:arylsulfatase A-like enzyme